MGLNFPEGKIPTLKWIAFHGNNGSNFDDDGVSSISRHSTGRYTVNFDGNMSSNDYALVAIGEYEYSCGTAGETHNAYILPQVLGSGTVDMLLVHHKMENICQ